MSGWRILAERLLRRAASGASTSRRAWLIAAASEVQAIERPGAAIAWVAGAAAMILRDLLGQAFFPWTRARDQRPPSLFAATLGLALLAGPAWIAATGGVASFALYALAGVGVMLGLWVNVATVLRAEPLGGLAYALSLRLLPLNIAVAALATAIGGALL